MRLTFHGEELEDKYGFQLVPEGRHEVRTTVEVKGEDTYDFMWPVTLKNGTLTPDPINIPQPPRRAYVSEPTGKSLWGFPIHVVSELPPGVEGVIVRPAELPKVKTTILGVPCKHCGHYKAEHTGGPCTHVTMTGPPGNSAYCGCTNYEPMEVQD
jgi:hypothetical protein